MHLTASANPGYHLPLLGELLSRSGTADVVDAHVALLVREADTVLTSDQVDIRRLLEVRRVQASVETV